MDSSKYLGRNSDITQEVEEVDAAFMLMSVIEKPPFVHKLVRKGIVYRSDKESFKSTAEGDVPDGEEVSEDHSVIYSDQVSTHEA